MNVLVPCLRMDYTPGVLVDNHTVEHVSAANCMVSNIDAGSRPVHAQTYGFVGIPVHRQRQLHRRFYRVLVVVDMEFPSDSFLLRVLLLVDRPFVESS